jgi:peroxiredoxin
MMNYTTIFTLITAAFLSTSTIKAQVPEQPEDISPLLIGETLPNATLKNSAGLEVQFTDIIQKKPTVLVFYRGGWCPYCNVQLSGLGAIETEIINLGYQIVAVSPDDFANLKTLEEQDSVHYKLFSDPGANLIQQVGIGFKTALKTKGYIAAKTKGKVTEILPVPTVMIVNQKGAILFEYINPNYKTRLSSEMLLAVLKTLK